VYRRIVILLWFFGLVFAELLGIGLAYLAYMSDMNEVFSGSIADIIIISTRFLFLAYIARITSINLSSAIYKPLPRRSTQLLFLVALIFIVLLLDYSITVYTSSKPYEPQLMGYKYYAEQGALWCFPLKVAYYLSEITVMNYMYMLAKKAWKIFGKPIIAGMLFLVFGWALPHTFTKNVFVAVYAVALVIIFYSGYELTNSPLVPITLWFTVLLV